MRLVKRENDSLTEVSLAHVEEMLGMELSDRNDQKTSPLSKLV